MTHLVEIYTFHFNNPNTTGLGQATAGSGYYYAYGNTLFIVLNSNSENYGEHERLISAIHEYPNLPWRFGAFHHDIYG